MCVTGIFWMSECTKASQYAVGWFVGFFLCVCFGLVGFFNLIYLYIQRVFWGREVLCFQGVLLKMQPLAQA